MNDVPAKPGATHFVLNDPSLPKQAYAGQEELPLHSISDRNFATVCKNAIDFRCNIASHLQLQNHQRVCGIKNCLADGTLALAVAKVPDESAFRGTELEVTVL